MEQENLAQNLEKQESKAQDPEIQEIQEFIDNGDTEELIRRRTTLLTLRIQLMKSIDAIKVSAPKGDKDLEDKEKQLKKWDEQFNLIMKGIKQLNPSNPE